MTHFNAIPELQLAEDSFVENVSGKYLNF